MCFSARWITLAIYHLRNTVNTGETHGNLYVSVYEKEKKARYSLGVVICDQHRCRTSRLQQQRSATFAPIPKQVATRHDRYLAGLTTSQGSDVTQAAHWLRFRSTGCFPFVLISTQCNNTVPASICLHIKSCLINATFSPITRQC